MSRKEKNTNKKKKNKKLLSSFLAICLIGASAAMSYVYFTTQKWNNVIFPNVIIKNIDLTGKTKEEAINILREKYGDEVLKRKINIKTSNRTYTIGYSGLNAKYNIYEVIDEALTYGKNLNMIEKYKLIRNPQNKELSLKFSYNEKPIEDTIKSMEKEINKQPIDAKIKMENGSFKTTADVKGAELESDKLKQEIVAKINEQTNSDINIEAPIKILSSKVTQNALKSINTKLTGWSTDFTSSSEERSTNIIVATGSINGTVLMPGEAFSFNEIVGERTKDRGYKAAPVIVNKKMEYGLGGGICQVSTTLYQAILRTNLKVTERVHHTFPSHYAGLGLDATIDWGNIDLKFKNTLDKPIYIQGYIKNKNVYFNIYSNSELNKRKYTITTDLYEKIEPKIQYQDNPSLPEGKYEVMRKAHTGYRVKVYRNTIENGKTINKELIYKDYYVVVNGITKKGTKKI
ncbi:VanW family protein [Clostridium aestuarii]|uniref:VanW family protein n=1 Tax=Clostridium aestuarii TaxID=338193 RepID=A0ABT4CYW9_9CLOT|nr:VanW family protein [Clostridium aestuarii]MCY6483160.1 VanW family protein [Clostridium aestuarii]